MKRKTIPKTIPLHPPEPQPQEPSQGFSIAWNPRRSCYVYRLHYTADPEKRDPRWRTGVSAGMSRAAFRREYEMDFTAPGDAPYYPEFAEEWEKHVAPLPGLIRGPVYRIWDFGRQHPACLFLQHSPRSQRIWVLREVLGTNINIWNFRDLVLFLSGQLDFSQIMAKRPQARRHLADLELSRKVPRFKSIPKPPWFSGRERFVDYSGYEALQSSDRVETETEDQSRASILAQSGIHLQIHQGGIEASTEIISQLILDWPDGQGGKQPGLMIDPACPLLIEGLKGGICYPKATKANPVPTQPHKDGYYEHLHDCLRYAATNLIPIGPRGEILRPDHVLGSGPKRRRRKTAPALAFGETYADRWK